MLKVFEKVIIYLAKFKVRNMCALMNMPTWLTDRCKVEFDVRNSRFCFACILVNFWNGAAKLGGVK